MRIAILLAALGTALMLGAAPALAAPGSLTVEHQAQPLAVEPARRCSAGTDRRATSPPTRSASRTSPDKLAGARTCGTPARSTPPRSAERRRTRGPALQSSQRYCWTVRTWDAERRRRRVGDARRASAPRSRATGRDADLDLGPGLGTDYSSTPTSPSRPSRSASSSALSGGNSFMWQIRGDSSNELRPHVQVNGTYTQMKAVKLPMTIGINVTAPRHDRRGRLDDHDLDRRRPGRHHDRHAQPERLDRLPHRQHRVRQRSTT